MSITLTYRGETSIPVEIEGLTPDWACDKSLAEIRKDLETRRKIPVELDLPALNADGKEPESKLTFHWLDGTGHDPRGRDDEIATVVRDWLQKTA